MSEIIGRLVKQRYNMNLFKSVLKSTNSGRMSSRSLKIVENWSYVLLFAFFLKLISRVIFMYNSSDLSITDFLMHDWWKIVIWFFVYTLFLDKLLGIGYHDSILKTRSNKYVVILILLIVYLIGNFFALGYFIGYLFDIPLLAISDIIACGATMIAYIIIFMCVLDFILYSTDNSDDNPETKGRYFDFL